MTARPTATGRAGGGNTPDRRRQRGLTYLIVLFLVALVGMGLAALGSVWVTDSQRERERELLFIGEQFGVALQRYYDASPGTKEYPRRLEDLLEDRRFQVPRRHLRQIFPQSGQPNRRTRLLSLRLRTARKPRNWYRRPYLPPPWVFSSP